MNFLIIGSEIIKPGDQNNGCTKWQFDSCMSDCAELGVCSPNSCRPTQYDVIN